MNLSTICMIGILRLEELLGTNGLGKLIIGGERAQNEFADLGNMLTGLMGVGAFVYMMFNKEKGKERAILVMIAAAGINLVTGGIIATIVSSWFGG